MKRSMRQAAGGWLIAAAVMLAGCALHGADAALSPSSAAPSPFTFPAFPSSTLPGPSANSPQQSTRETPVPGASPAGPTRETPASDASPAAPPLETPAPTALSPAAADPAGDPDPAAMTALLATLPVKGRAPKTGYDRALFGPAWTDDVDVDGGHNGCDTRNDILRRDLVDVEVKPGTYGCLVLTGTLHDAYTGTTIDFTRGQVTSQAVQIDHVVALSDAWQKGAQALAPDRLRDFANDPLNLQAVDGPTNARKRDGDAATWLPPNKDYRCTYVSRQVQVKAKYALWVTRAERDAIARILATC